MGGGGSTTTGYKYYANVLIGICEGPAYILNVWNGKAKQSFENSGMDIMYGPLGQDPWPQNISAHPSEALGYSGLCYVAKQAMELDSSASLPALSFEVVGGGRVMDDADASYILRDFLTNPIYGAGWPTSFLDDVYLGKYSSWCQASNLLVSPALTEQTQASDFLQQLAIATNSQYVWSQNKLRVVPFCDEITGGNDYTYFPDLTPKYDLDYDDFIVNGDEDPVTCTRNSSADAFNHVQVEFVNRANDYNVEVAEARDLADIEAKGLRTQDPLQLHMICDPAIARDLAQYRLQQVLYRRAQYTFKLGWKYCLLEPLDLITITDAAMGLNRAPVQIMEIAEDEEGVFTVTALEFPFGVSSTGTYDSQGNSGYVPDYKIDPGDSNAPVIFEPPYALAGRTEVWLGTSGGSDWGGCEVHVSTDGSSYTKIGSINAKARHGVLTSLLPFGYDPDTTNTLAVDLTVSGGTLQSATHNDADLLSTLSYVGGELVAYADATLTAVNKYSLSYLRRGAYGTTVEAHPSNTKFMRLDGAIFKYAVPTNMLGKTLYVKLPAFNIYGTQLQDLANVPVYTYGVTGGDAVPLAVGGFTATAGLASVMLSWTINTADTGLDHYEILRASSDDRNQAKVIGTTTGNGYADMVGVTGVTYYYWVRGVSKANVKGPLNAVHGLSVTTGKIGTTDLGPLIVEAGNLANGSVTSSKIGDSAVTATKIASAAVGTAAIQNAAITNALIASAAIDSAKIADAAIITAKIADAAITNAKIASLTADKISTGNLRAVHISVGDAANAVDFYEEGYTSVPLLSSAYTHLFYDAWVGSSVITASQLNFWHNNTSIPKNRRIKSGDVVFIMQWTGVVDSAISIYYRVRQVGDDTPIYNGLWDCTNCYEYTYNPAYGEPSENVAAGTTWENVPSNFACPVCSADKSYFAPEYTTNIPAWTCATESTDNQVDYGAASCAWVGTVNIPANHYIEFGMRPTYCDGSYYNGGKLAIYKSNFIIQAVNF